MRTTAVRFSKLQGLSKGRCVALKAHPPENGRNSSPSKAVAHAARMRRSEPARLDMLFFLDNRRSFRSVGRRLLSGLPFCVDWTVDCVTDDDLTVAESETLHFI